MMDESTAKDLFITTGSALSAQIKHADCTEKLLLDLNGGLDDSKISEVLLRLDDIRVRLEDIHLQVEMMVEPQFEGKLKAWTDEALEAAQADCETKKFVTFDDKSNQDDDSSLVSSMNKQHRTPTSESNTGHQNKEKETVEEKKRKAPNKSAQQTKRTKKDTGEVMATVERKTLLANSRNIVQRASQCLSNHPVEAVNLRLAEIIISQVKEAYNPKNPRLSRIQTITRNLFIILQSQSKWKKKLLMAHACFEEKGKAVEISDDYGNLESASTVGEILLHLEKNITARETAMKREVPADIEASLFELQSAIHRLDTGDDEEVDTSKSLSKAEINKMKSLVNFDQAMENLFFNMLHLSLMISIEGACFINQLATFAVDKTMTKKKQAEVRAESEKYLNSFDELWSIMNPDDDQFNGNTTTMLEYRENVLLPALASKETERKELAIRVNRDMMTLTTDMRRKGQKEKILPLVRNAQSETLTGNAQGDCEVDYCADPKQADRRRRMACTQHNLSASDNIEEHLPASLYPNGMTHKLLINAPSRAATACNFHNEKLGLFDRVHDEKSSIAIKMNKYLKDHHVGEKTIFINEALVDALNQLLLDA
jgi:hypothetical protein